MRDIFVCMRASGSSLNAGHTVLCGCVEGPAVPFFDMGCASQWCPYPAVTCLVSCSPEGYEKLYLLGDGFWIFS